MEPTITNLIQAMVTNKPNEASNIFNELMQVNVDNVIANKQEQIAKTIFNPVEKE